MLLCKIFTLCLTVGVVARYNASMVYFLFGIMSGAMNEVGAIDLLNVCGGKRENETELPGGGLIPTAALVGCSVGAILLAYIVNKFNR